MGRPLNKKYFGNRNIGVGGNQVGGNNSNNQNYADDRIGGEGFAGVTFGASVADTSYGSGAYLERIPTISIAPPTIPGGVSAVATVSHVQAVHAVPNLKGTGYQIGDIVEGTTGTGTKARFRVTKLKVVDITVNYATSGTNWDGGEWVVWDDKVQGNWTSPTILKSVTIGGVGGHRLTGLAKGGAGSYGVWDGTYGGGPLDLAPIGPQTIVGGNNTPNPTNPSYNTRGDGDYNGPTNDPVNDNNASGGTVTFTYGIEAVEVVTGYQGDYTVVDAASQAVTNVSGTGTNATLDIYYGVKTIAVTQKGSGYTGVEPVTFASTIVDHSETRATGTIVLTTDSGLIGSNNNQENAILMTAQIGSTVGTVDIIRQVSTRRYKVKGSNAVATVKLKASAVSADGDANLVATDEFGATYYVTKLTGHRATLTQKTSGFGSPGAGQWVFITGAAAPWRLTGPTTGYVKIDNA